MKKYENCRVVTFKEDYNPSYETRKSDAPIYKKGETVAIDKGLVEKLQKKGVEMSVDRLDFKNMEEKLRDRLQKQRRAQAAA